MIFLYLSVSIKRNNRLVNGMNEFNDENAAMMTPQSSINVSSSKFPYCIVWTPIPLLTWLFPFIGHMGIGTSSGVIRDFAGSYYVSEDNMAFGKPTKYWKLNPSKAFCNWDTAISSAAEVYKTRTHNLCTDNCHSMVAMALNTMKYDNSDSWNMVKLTVYMIIYSRYVSVVSFLKTLLPFCIFWSVVVVIFYHSELGF